VDVYAAISSRSPGESGAETGRSGILTELNHELTDGRAGEASAKQPDQKHHRG